MKLADFDFRIWVGGFAIANGEVWNGGYIDDSYMKKNQFNKVIAMGLVKFYDKNKEKLDDIEFFTFYNNVGFNHGVSNDIEIELWSGYVDINNTKIYEGDIVKYQNAIIPIITREDFPEEFYRICEVIGNIHENADLLENHSKEQE